MIDIGLHNTSRVVVQRPCSSAPVTHAWKVSGVANYHKSHLSDHDKPFNRVFLAHPANISICEHGEVHKCMACVPCTVIMNLGVICCQVHGAL